MQPNSNLALERRSKARFPVKLNVRYRTLSDGPVLVGVGQTVNISSRGLLIACDKAKVHTGSRMQLTVDWPFLLHGSTPLQLVIAGRVTRCHVEEFAVQLDQYQFRTKKR
jgi:PilZ domain